MSKVVATLCFRKYGFHKTVKTTVLPGELSRYVDDKPIKSRNHCAVHEDKLLEDLPEKFLPVPAKNVLLTALGTGMFCTQQFLAWAKYFDSYSLHIDREQSLRIWLDDVRKKPDGFDIHIKEAVYTIKILKKGIVTHISFDHDLGDETANTGYSVATAIEEMAYSGEIPRLTWAIHSANPVGRENIRRAMESAERYWSRNESIS